MFFELSGVNESRAISQKAISKAVGLFREYFNDKTHFLYSWGSVARREMGPFSDLDLIIASQHPDYRKIAKYQKTLGEALPNHRLDILERHTPKELQRIAEIDGTDRQAIFFSRNETPIRGASHELTKIQSHIQTRDKNLREIFHILVNLEFVYPKLFGPCNLKFSPGRLKDFYFAYLLANSLDQKRTTRSIPEALSYLKNGGYISASTLLKSKSAFSDVLYLRNKTQEIKHSYHSVLDRKTAKTLCRREHVDAKSLKNLINETQEVGRNLFEDLKKLSLELAKKGMTEKNNEMLEEVLNLNGHSKTLAKNIIKSKEEILLMVLAYVSRDPEVLEILRRNSLTKWYVLYGIANNPYTHEKTFISLMSPSAQERHIIKNLYSDFAWRNIYLYIAKNPAATKKVKQLILQYPNARPMDIEAVLATSDPK